MEFSWLVRSFKRVRSMLGWGCDRIELVDFREPALSPMQERRMIREFKSMNKKMQQIQQQLEQVKMAAAQVNRVTRQLNENTQHNLETIKQQRTDCDALSSSMANVNEQLQQVGSQTEQASERGAEMIKALRSVVQTANPRSLPVSYQFELFRLESVQDQGLTAAFLAANDAVLPV